jgi:CRISPR-associated protein Csh2
MELTNRTEIVFCYDIKDNNPNGDPLDGNKPRIDEATDTNIVTDVRLKRSVRDYLRDFKGKEILIERIEHDDGTIQTGIERAMNFVSTQEQTATEEKSKKRGVRATEEIVRKNVLAHCIDARLFGCTLPLEKGSVILTGPVQFCIGHSLNKVELTRIKGSGAFASGADISQETFREEYILPYSFITFYGIVNENAAKDTELTAEDVALLYDGLWNGTKNLISRSKVGQLPRLLMTVTYKESNYYIGDLDKALVLKPISGLKEEQVRGVGDFTLDISNLLDLFKENADKILNVMVKTDSRLHFSVNGNDLGNDIETALRDLGLTVASFEGF